jgi:hypothetical protein
MISAWAILVVSSFLIQQPQPTVYPAPQDVRIVRFELLRPGEFTGNQIPNSDAQGIPTGNLPMRAEYGFEPRGRNEPPTESPPQSEEIRGGGTRYPQYDSRTWGPQCRVWIQNTGARTIKRIEWEYAILRLPSRQFPGLAAALQNADWVRMRNGKRIAPGRIEFIECSIEGKRGQQLVLSARGVRLIRVDYTNGPSWHAP